MAPPAQRDLETRVARAAAAALADHKFVTSIDVLVGLGWLTASQVDVWRQGRVPCLERAVQANLTKISTAMGAFRRWATQQGLQPSETGYVARTRDRRVLRFSVSGDPKIEEAYRTHWVSPALSEAKRARLAEQQSKAPDLVVVEALRQWKCSLCSGTGELLIMEDDGPVCLACADLDHVAGLGLVLASEPSLLKVMAIVPEAVPVAVVVSDVEVGLAKLALQVLVPVLVQVTCIEFAAPSES